MPFLASFLMSAFNALLVYLSQRFTKKIGMALFSIGVISSLAIAFYTLIKGLVVGITYSITNEWILMGMGILWPPNAEPCITAILTADIAAYVFRFKKSVYWGKVF